MLEEFSLFLRFNNLSQKQKKLILNQIVSNIFQPRALLYMWREEVLYFPFWDLSFPKTQIFEELVAKKKSKQFNGF